MKTNQKLKYFEYFVFLLIRWQHEMTSGTIEYTKLKLQKLLFLVSAVNASKDNRGLFDIFDNFYAMQYGPVESDIYNAMVGRGFKHIVFENRVMKNPVLDASMFSTDHNTQLIDKAFKSIRSINEKLILLSSTELVNITHKWPSWQKAMFIAESLGKGSEKMVIEKICEDQKYFN